MSHLADLPDFARLMSLETIVLIYNCSNSIAMVITTYLIIEKIHQHRRLFGNDVIQTAAFVTVNKIETTVGLCVTPVCTVCKPALYKMSVQSVH